MNPISHYFNLFYLFISIIWPPLQMYHLGVDSGGYTILALSIIALVWNSPAFWRQEHVMRSPAFLCWMALLAFSIVNSFMKGFVSEWGSLVFYKNNYIVPFIFLFVLVVELDWDFDKCLKVLLFALFTYILLCLGNMGIDKDERMVAEGLRNILPLHTTCFVFVGSMLLTRQRLPSIIFWCVVIIAVVVTMLSGTRKALGAIVILLMGVAFSHDGGKEQNLWYYTRLALFLAILYIGLNYIMDNTMMGERLADTAEESKVEFVENETVNWFLNNLLGDRSIQYELGFGLFLLHPLTGIGITNFIPISGFPFRLHTEYMTQLCENGIIGFSLLILFYFILLRKLYLRQRDYDDNITMVLFGLFALLFLNITAWTYNQNFGMIYYGIVLTYAYYEEFDMNDEEIEELEDMSMESSDQIL